MLYDLIEPENSEIANAIYSLKIWGGKLWLKGEDLALGGDSVGHERNTRRKLVGYCCEQ